MENTANETWIDKLIDELIDTKDEVSQLRLKEARLDCLIAIILNNSRLNYGGEGLRIENESAILEYLKAIYKRSYEARIDELKAEREAELKKIAETAEYCKKESKGKEEA